MNVEKLPSFHFLPSTGLTRTYLDLLKWIALFSMALFHYGHSVVYMPPEIITIIGRLAFPLFAFILGYNIALAIEKNDKTVEKRLMKTLLVFGCFAQPFYWGFIHSPLPLNVMFSLALGVYMVFNYKTVFAWIALALCGLFVDYAWFGALFVLASYLVSTDLMKSRIGLFSGIAFSTSLISLTMITSSPYPLLVLPLLLFGLVWQPNFKLPRCKWFFYAFYPVHLALLQAFSHFM